MPVLDGLQATKQIRSIEKARTAHDQTWQEFPVDIPSPMYQRRREVRGKRDSAGLCTLQTLVVGVSACSKTEQVTSARFDGLLTDHLTGGHFLSATRMAELLMIVFVMSYRCLLPSFEI